MPSRKLPICKIVLIYKQLCFQIVSATFLLVCFVCLKGSTCETRKKVCYYISNISRFLQKFHFPREVVLNTLKTQKSLELVFRLQFLKNYLMKLFSLEYDINWSNFINRLSLPLKLFSKMYFLSYAVAFDNIIKFENLKF